MGARHIQFIQSLKRHKVWFLLPVLVVPVCVLVYLLCRNPQYQATSEVIFLPSPKETSQSTSQPAIALETLIALMQSDAVAEQLKAEYEKQLAEKAHHSIAKAQSAPLKLQYQASQPANTIRITAFHPQATWAAWLSNKAASMLITETQRLYQPDTLREATTLATQIAETQGQLEQLDGMIKEYKTSHHIASLDSKTTMLQNRLEQLETNQAEARGIQEGLRMKIRGILENLGVQSSQEAVLLAGLNEDSNIQALHQAWVEAKINLEELKAHYGPAHPRLKQAQFLARDLEDQFKSAVKAYLSENNQGVSLAVNQAADTPLTRSQLEAIEALIMAQLDSKAKQAYLHQLDADITALQRQLESLPEEEYQLVRLQREHHQLEQKLSMLTARQAENAFRQSTGGPRVEISKQAVARKPDTPLASIVFALLASPLLGAFLVLGAGLVDERRQVHEQPLEDILHIPVLQKIPEDKSLVLAMGNHKHDFSDVFSEDKDTARSLLPILHQVSIKPDLMQLKARLFSPDNLESSTWAVMGSTFGSGSTFLTLQLALRCAESGMRTLLIEGDMRQPDIHTCLGMPQAPGLTDLLDETAVLKDIVYPAQAVSNFYVIPAGTVSQDPLGYLEHPRLKVLMETFANHFDAIFWTTPANPSLLDGYRIAVLCDKVLLVAREATLTAASAQKWQQQLAGIQAKIAGLVVNFTTAGQTK